MYKNLNDSSSGKYVRSNEKSLNLNSDSRIKIDNHKDTKNMFDIQQN